jgi:diaminopimelate decarboxylase
MTTNKSNKINFKFLAEKYNTPLYIYDANTIIRQYNKMLQAFSNIKNLQINYACKANTNLNILKLLNRLGSHLDTVSIQEVILGLKAGYSSNKILFTPNGVSLDEIKQAISLKVNINVDNLSILEQLGNTYKGIKVGIRINPHIMAGGHSKISVGHIDSKFGISHYQLPHIQRIIKNTNIQIEGLHMHTGSDILDIDTFLRGSKILMNIAKSFKNLRYINLGSGFKVPYKIDDNQTDLNKLGLAISKKFNSFCKEYGSDITLIFEPGKFIISESGFFLVHVNVIKHTISTVFAGVDSGFNHFIRPMFYDAYHHIENISNPNGKLRFYTIVGYICESDTFALNRQLPEIREGDILCFNNAGAYCFSMASNYNSRYKPAEILILNNKDFLIRKRENIEDITRSIVDIKI